LNLARWDDGFNVLRFVQHVGRETMGQMKFANDDFHIDTEIIFIAQDLNHSSPRILGGRRPVGDFDIHNHAFEIVPFGTTRGFLA